MATSVSTLDFTFTPAAPKCVIEANGTVTQSGDVELEDSVFLRVSNQSHAWAAVVCETIDGEYFELIRTARLNPGDVTTDVRALPGQVAGRKLHIYRWAPGIFGVPGSGGGEAVFTMPAAGAVSISITCIHV
ncbi:hypothetical protein ACFPK1_12300 [Actinomycetospora rhizophila]|uniref:Uncharacterized protein n=1 Tax=Actinomycetospora rhizophila TaxID=1416876 RepID=A0ABV9ZBN7_9PSEU